MSSFVLNALFFIFLFAFPTTTYSINFEIIKGDAPVCSIDKTKDNQNDPCNPDNLKNSNEEDKTNQDISKEPVMANKKSKSAKNNVVANKTTEPQSNKKIITNKKITILFFWGDGCPHCADEKPFLESMKTKYPDIDIVSIEVWHNKTNAIKFQEMSSKYGLKASGVPVTIIGTKAIVGFSESLKKDIEKAIIECSKTGCPNPFDEKIFSESHQISLSEKKDDISKDSSQSEENVIDIPLIGKTDVSKMALPLMTIVIAGLDSFNPCAFFVLFTLLGLMLHAKSRKRMFIIGGVFVFFSGFMYFLFMSAWLNFFLIMGEVALITTIAGIISILIASINIKDFFIFKAGVSLTISDKHKNKLFDRMRKL
ncbi:MAG: thioredoxin domain-containing protein, partial [Thermodesulfovibrionales bacterium]|nr:thioredoxin domain-containing protein [Thermodesulfovibrionales bacterium]